MNEDGKKPWPVRIALGWFVLLAIACCVPCVCMLVAFCRDGAGLGEWVLGLVTCLGFISLGAGFVLAILRGKRDWVTIPYLLIGLLAIFLPLTGSSRPEFALGLKVYLIAVAFATIVPPAFLYFPSSSRWFAALPRQKGFGIGCGTLLILAFLGMMASSIDVRTPERKMLSAHMSALAMRGRNVFITLNRAAVEGSTVPSWAELCSCSNSVEFAEKVSVGLDGVGKELMLRAGREWSFAVNVPPDAPDLFPGMISANVDPSGLPREWDGVTDGDKHLELKPLEGVEPLRFGDKAIVIIRKSGAAHVVKRKYMTRKIIFGDKPHKLGTDTYFLTPVGRR